MSYDAIVIGSGQAGNPLSHRLADQGWKVALVEKAHLGGTCINTGCTPTKTMVASAQVAHYARNAARWGVRASGVSVDLGKVVDRKNKVVESFRSGQQSNVDRRPNLTLHRGQARFLAPRRVQVGDQVLEGERIFINTGTRTDMPRLEGLDQVPYLTNASLMEMREVPENLLVLGGGYIGLEFGQMFHRFGSQVTVVHRGEHILAREDNDVADELQKILEGESIRFVLQAQTSRVARKGGKIELSYSLNGRPQTTSDWRRPASKPTSEVSSGWTTASGPTCPTTGRWATSKAAPPSPTSPTTTSGLSTATSSRRGAGRSTTAPSPIFTDPQLGRVGLTEQEARATGRKVKLGKYPMAYIARAIERDETGGFMKLVVDAENDRILGAAILGSEGGELVQMLGALMLADVPYTVLKGAVYIHPTLAEGFFGLMEDVKPMA